MISETVDWVSLRIAKATWMDLYIFADMPRIYGGWPDPRAVPSAWGSLSPVRGDIISRGLDTIFGRWLPGVKLCVKGHGCASGYSAGQLLSRTIVNALQQSLDTGLIYELAEAAQRLRWPVVTLVTSDNDKRESIRADMLLRRVADGLALGFYSTLPKKLVLVRGSVKNGVVVITLVNRPCMRKLEYLDAIRLVQRYHPLVVVVLFQ